MMPDAHNWRREALMGFIASSTVQLCRTRPMGATLPAGEPRLRKTRSHRERRFLTDCAKVDSTIFETSAGGRVAIRLSEPFLRRFGLTTQREIASEHRATKQR